MPHPTSEELLKAAIEISDAAAAIPMRYFRADLAVEDKADQSPVTIADKKTEEQIRREIGKRFPSHGILGEEFGRKDSASEHTWVIDPIDGTRSFVCGVPHFGMLLGVLRGGVPEVGVIRMPALGECFAGRRGGVATKDGAPIRCRLPPPLAEARLFINEANLFVEREPERLARLMRVGHTRRFFNDCYPFALLAMGQIDVVVDFDLKPYDFLPVVPVLEAAGGVITDWQGRPLGLESDGTIVAAGDAAIHREMLALLA